MSETELTATEEMVPLEASEKVKDSKKSSSHPKTADMVNAAIKNLKEKNGSSLQAIKKYVAANYNVDADKMAPFIRKYLKSAVTSGSLVQTTGNGATGSFKMAKIEKIPKKVKPKIEEVDKVKTKKEKVNSPKEKATKKKVVKEKASKTTNAPDSPKKPKSKPSPEEQPPTKTNEVDEIPVGTTKSASSPKKKKATKAASSSPSMLKKKQKSPMKNPKIPKPKKAQKPKSPK